MKQSNFLTQKVLSKSAAFSLPFLQKALLSKTMRSKVIAKFEKQIFDRYKKSDLPCLPDRVRQDKIDMARALLASANRALDRNLVSPKVLHRLLETFLCNVLLGQDEGSRAETIVKFSKRHAGKLPPSVIVISPTKGCNLYCVGCYANSGPEREHLPWDIFNRIISEARDLWGLHFITISGGEPLTYRSQGKDLIDAARNHSDCFFMMYTNGTLIDKTVVERLADTGNLIPAISLEGFEARTDERRGRGVFQRVLSAMSLLRNAGVPFGISLTATRHNAFEILSDDFINFCFDQQQASFGWLFQYMPIGRCSTLDLQVTPEQRLWMWQRTWQIIRERHIMLADFWNCGTVADGCIAAGQSRGGGYLYIDWNGKIMPCAFVPYAAGNIHDIYRCGGTLDDVYELPYLQAIRQWQWDYALGKEQPEKCGNLLLPCSLRDNYATGRELIDKYHPEPEDEAAAEALADDTYYHGMVAYDEELRRVFDPVWEEEYVHNTPKRSLVSQPQDHCAGVAL